ncbi:DUF3400 domain-containing protein, partial [Burkholderia glumae]|uniref:DUF3400 domain-containing protein n=1 Tax=Burkholderia glumae TaxID=337 RepID=UPI000CBDF791
AGGEGTGGVRGGAAGGGGQQGGDAGIEADYIGVEIARSLLGENWMADYVARANHGGIERVLV